MLCVGDLGLAQKFVEEKCIFKVFSFGNRSIFSLNILLLFLDANFVRPLSRD